MNQKKPLKDQLDRLTSQRQAWQQRREVFLRRATKEQIREWTKASQALLDDLATEEEYARIKIAEIDNWLEEFEPEQAPALATSGFESTIRDWLEKQIGNLRSLRLIHKDNRKSILATQKLYTSFLKEIDKDSLADTARNRLLEEIFVAEDVWRLLAAGEALLVRIGELRSIRDLVLEFPRRFSRGLYGGRMLDYDGVALRCGLIEC